MRGRRHARAAAAWLHDVATAPWRSARAADGARSDVPIHADLGEGVRVGDHVVIEVAPGQPGCLSVGQGASIGRFVTIRCKHGVLVGAGAHLGDHVVVVDDWGALDDAGRPVPSPGGAPVVVGAEAVVGASSVLAPGAVIPDRAVVAPGSRLP